MALPYIMVNNKRYMSTKYAAEVWNKKQSTISKYCKNGKIPNSKCIKDDHGHWYIDINAIYPLDDSDVRKLLTLTLQLKNNPQYSFDWSLLKSDAENIRPIYEYLADMKYIHPYQIEDSMKLPYDVVLTEKGMSIVVGFSGKDNENSFLNNSIAQWLSVSIQLAQVLLQAKQ